MAGFVAAYYVQLINCFEQFSEEWVAMTVEVWVYVVAVLPSPTRSK